MPASLPSPPEILFYDGQCGLCHHAVQFILHHDRTGTAFRFAPLGGDTFQTRIPPNRRAGLPDSMVLETRDGRLLVRSQAWIHILQQLGGGWKLLAEVIALVPRPLRDEVYDFIAAIRSRLFARPSGVCPMLPPELRSRFDP